MKISNMYLLLTELKSVEKDLREARIRGAHWQVDQLKAKRDVLTRKVQTQMWKQRGFLLSIHRGH